MNRMNHPVMQMGKKRRRYDVGERKVWWLELLTLQVYVGRGVFDDQGWTDFAVGHGNHE